MDTINENIVSNEIGGKNNPKENTRGRRMSIAAQKCIENFENEKEKEVRKYFQVWCQISCEINDMICYLY